MTEWEQFLELIPDEGCGTPAARFLLSVITEASIKRLISDEQVLDVAREVTGA